MLMGGPLAATNRSLYPSLSYRPVADFAPVTLICSFSIFMFVPNSLPVQSVKEFIAYAKANKGKLTLASPGTGTSPHLCGELFKRMAGIDMIHVPYRGAGPALNDLIPGPRPCDVLGRRRARELAGRKAARARHIPAPSGPQWRRTCRPSPRTGVPGFDVTSWYGFFVPAKTPPEIVKKINADAVAALADPASTAGSTSLAMT